jgi:hypothetical protein
VSLELEVPLQPLIDAPEEPAQLTQFIDQLASSRGHNCLGREDVGVLKLGKLNVLPLDALKDKEEVPHDQVLIYWLLVPRNLLLRILSSTQHLEAHLPEII